MCKKTPTPEYAAFAAEQASRYLKRIRDAKRHIAALNAEVDEQRALASGLKGIDYSRDMVQTSPSDDAMPNAVARLMDVIAQRVELVRDYAEMLSECGESLARMNGTGADILRYRYLCNWPWERIAAETGYSEQWLYELHNRAMATFYDYMPAHERDPLPRAI